VTFVFFVSLALVRPRNTCLGESHSVGVDGITLARDARDGGWGILASLACKALIIGHTVRVFRGGRSDE